MRSIHRLTGTRPLNTTVTFDDVIFFVEYPTPTSWQADVMLEPDRTDYIYTFGDGIYYTATIDQKSTEFTRASGYNILDDWGLRMDTKRLPEESNLAFKSRLLDVMVHRGNATHQGIVNAIARDLGLEYSDQALIIRAASNPYTGQVFDNIIVGVSSTNIFVYGPALYVTREKAPVSPLHDTCTPAHDVAANLLVTDEDGTPVEFDYDSRSNEVFIKDATDRDVVYLTYFYMLKVNRMLLTLNEIKAALEALQAPNELTILDVTVATGFEDMIGSRLVQVPEKNASGINLDAAGEEVDGVPVRWTDLRLESVWDPLVQDHERNWTGSLFNTRFDSASESLIHTAKQTWGTAVADETLWGHTNVPLHGGQCLDTIYDSPLAYWDVGAEHVDAWMAPSLDATHKGVLEVDLQSGVGQGTDLKVVIDSDDPALYTEEENQESVSEASSFAEPTGDTATTGGLYIP